MTASYSHFSHSPDNLVSVCEDFLTDTRHFTKIIPKFRGRPQQIAMARHIAAAIMNKTTLVIEAGTGVGKTFAYLLPAVLSGKRVVISTYTRYLQEQVYYKDLPNLLSVLDLQHEVNITLLKGRANYLCLDRLHKHSHTPELDEEFRSLIEKISAWSKQTLIGDISEFKELSEENPLWSTLTSTPESCLGTKCSFYDDCFIVQARKQALAAKMVIVNHYLLLADMNLKEDGFGQLLPRVDTVIVDEAHQLNDVADNFLGTSISNRKIQNLMNDIENEDSIRDTPALKQTVEQVKKELASLADYLKDFPPRDDIMVLLQEDTFRKIVNAFQNSFSKLEALLSAQKDRSEELQHCWQRAQVIYTYFQETLFSDESQTISWYQQQAGYFQFHSSPAEIAPILREGCNLYDANWIYTSATLSVNGKFDYLCRTLGLDEDSECIALDSPFNYQKQAILYLPDDLPDPNDPGHTEALLEASYPVLEVLGGKAFFLFTSHRALKIAEKELKKKKKFCLLVQGSAPKRELIRQFYEQPGALLLGTAGFWEGVDVRGAGLRCVVIDRLPFASPQDPLVQGRNRIARSCDKDFFIETTLPEAVVSLRQGIGRLIRDEDDSGVIMIGDQRIWKKSYGKIFLNSFPKMDKYRDFDSLFAHLKKIK